MIGPRRPRTKRRQRRTALSVQNLEDRRLMAGDMPNEPVMAQVSSALVSTDFTIASVNRLTSSGTATSSGATDLGAIDGMRSMRGRLDGSNRLDFKFFSLERDAEVDLYLWGLRHDANLLLIDQQGRLIAHSNRPGRSIDQISTTLERGEYMAIVYAPTASPTNYGLSMLARLEAVPTPPANPTLPDVPQFGGSLEWNLNVIGAPEAWAAGYTGQGVTIAVVDSGIDLDHPDLVHSLYVNAGEIAGNGVDDDRNGYIDDVHGYDFVSDDATAEDTNGHGTHVAGTIAAANNGFGATGVAPDAKIIPVRVLDGQGSGSTRDVASGIRYAADLGADIINLSLGGGYSHSIATAIDYARSLGALIVAAAGNDSDSVPSYPGRFSATDPNVISVGAYRSNGNRAGFSNRVGNSGAVQIDAPGAGIYSTYRDGRYATKSGTSMAAPHVSGLAALALSSNPNLTATALRNLLVSGASAASGNSDSVGKALANTTVGQAASEPGRIGSMAAVSIASSPAPVATFSAVEVGITANSHSMAFTESDPSWLLDRDQDMQVENRDTRPNQSESGARVANFATLSGSRNSSVDRYFEAFSDDLESQIDTPTTLNSHDFA